MRTKRKTSLPTWMTARGALYVLIVVMLMTLAVATVGEQKKSDCTKSYKLGVADAALMAAEKGSDYQQVYKAAIAYRKKETPNLIEGL